MLFPLARVASLFLLGFGPDGFSPELGSVAPAHPGGTVAAATPNMPAQFLPFVGEVPQPGMPLDSPPPAMDAASPSAAPVDGQIMTLDEMRAEMRKLAWTKGDFTIMPYGILWGSMSHETQRSNTGDFTLFVFSPTTNPGNDVNVDARSTRFGLDILGPRIDCLGCAASGGKIEIDFQRTIDTENRAGVQLRHAYVEVKNEEYRLLAGQTYDVISPLTTGTLMYSVGWGGGDIGYRRAQFRGERYLAFSDQTLLTVQGSANTDITADTTTTTTGDHAGWPVMEGRLGMTLGPRGAGQQPIEFGASAHIGEQLFDVRDATGALVVANASRRTWSLNADFKVPLTEQLGVEGEFFTGENLSTFFGGILQGIDLGTAARPGTLGTIHSNGGWFDVWYHWTPRLHSRVGYSLDDPVDQDITVGRLYNQFFFGNLSFDVTPKFLVGIEVSSWKTLYTAPQAPGDSFRTELAVKYGF